VPLVSKGKLKGFYLPDYDGGSIVNLLSSITRSRGGRSPHRELAGLPASSLTDARNVVYVVIDGIGEAQLDAFLSTGQGQAFFALHEHQVISTVFPATTAVAVTTFATGASPAEHAILGWYLHLHDLGLVGTILPGTTRTGVPMTRAEFDLDAYLQLPSYLESALGRRELLTYAHIVRSRFSQVGTNWQRRSAYQTLRGMERQIVSFAKRAGRGLAYAYWPEYDSYCHEAGCRHALAEQHLAEIDLMLGRLVQRLRGTNTMLLVLADHGLVDAPPRQRIDLSKVQGFYDCLAVLPSGDTRGVCCFVRPARVKRFLSLVKQQLSAACVCVRGEELIDSGAFGRGRKHPALTNRVGDYVLLAKGSHAFISTVPGSTAAFSVGNHGGMSRAEVLVPLYAVRC
jgi:hypothetical protein